MQNPYKRRKINGRPVDEHRHVMEQHLGRKLGRFERLYSQGVSQREIAAMFYANQSQISRIITGTSYRQYNG